MHSVPRAKSARRQLRSSGSARRMQYGRTHARAAALLCVATFAGVCAYLTYTDMTSVSNHVDPWFYGGPRKLKLGRKAILKGSWHALLQFRSICQQHDVPFMIVAGTLLGAWRAHELIPWDIDQDVMVWAEDVERLRALTGRYGPHRRFIFQSQNQDVAFRVIDSKSGGYVDVFALNRSLVDSRGLVTAFSFVPFDSALLTPIGTITLRNETFPAPNRVEEFLRTQYTTLAPVRLPSWVYNKRRRLSVDRTSRLSVDT